MPIIEYGFSIYIIEIFRQLNHNKYYKVLFFFRQSLSPVHKYPITKLTSTTMNNQNSMTDEKLIQFYLNGDPNALATLVELYKDRIYRSIYSIVQDKHAAEEIFREVFIRIINNLMAGKTAEDGNFLQWATKIANGLCMEYTRKSRQAIVLEPVTGKEPVEESPAAISIHPSGYHESHGKIKSMIDMLPDQQREVLVLNHYAGLSFREIAETLQCSLNSALDTMRFGLNNLRKLMTEKEVVLQ